MSAKHSPHNLSFNQRNQEERCCVWAIRERERDTHNRDGLKGSYGRPEEGSKQQNYGKLEGSRCSLIMTQLSNLNNNQSLLSITLSQAQCFNLLTQLILKSLWQPLENHEKNILDQESKMTVVVLVCASVIKIIQHLSFLSVPAQGCWVVVPVSMTVMHSLSHTTHIYTQAR